MLNKIENTMTRLIAKFCEKNDDGIIFMNDNSFLAEVRKSKQTENIREICSLTDDQIITIANKIIGNKNEKAKEAIKERKLINDLKMLIVSKEDSHVGTKLLNKFYSGFGQKYETDYKVRFKHSSRIANIRRQIRKENKAGNNIAWIISGKSMKKFLRIEHDVVFDNGKRTTIDGWCYTKNKVEISNYFTQEINKHKNLMENYKAFHELLDK